MVSSLTSVQPWFLDPALKMKAEHRLEPGVLDNTTADGVSKHWLLRVFAEIEVSLRGLQSSTLLKESFRESCSRDFCGLELLNIRIKVWLIPVSNSRELEDVRFLGS